MTTIHSNSCRDALTRLEQMIGMAGLDLPAKTTRAQIASAINVVIQLDRLSDGKRRLMSLNEITGMEGEVVQMQEIIGFRRTGIDEEGRVCGQYVSSGIRPKFMQELDVRGITVPQSIFDPGASFDT